jgi:hypothetical protein
VCFFAKNSQNVFSLEQLHVVTDRTSNGIPKKLKQYNMDMGSWTESSVWEITPLAATVTGLRQETRGPVTSVNIYPNPARDKIYFDALKGKNNVQLFAVSGQLVLEKYVTNQEAVDVSSLQPGLYFVQLKDENNNTAVHKFVKE